MHNTAYELVNTLLGELQSRFSGYEENEIVTQAALLDLRFKKMAFDGYSQRKLKLAIDQLKKKVCQVTLPGTDNPTASTSFVNASSSSSSSLIWKRFDQQYEANQTSINPTAAGIIELDRYLQEPLISRCEDPLKWWTEHKLMYPRLYVMVRKRSCVTATSVPCERLFSKAGMVITEKKITNDSLQAFTSIIFKLKPIKMYILLITFKGCRIFVVFIVLTTVTYSVIVLFYIFNILIFAIYLCTY